MENSLLQEFEIYEKIKTKLRNADKLNPTIVLPLISNGTIKFKETNTLKKLNKNKDNSVETTNQILDNLNIDKTNISILKFIFHELIGNIYDHSKFNNAYIMGKSHFDYYEFSFIDDGISIPTSLKNNGYNFKKDSEAILSAINGLSTKNELGYIERGTGLNNSTNIVVNGGCGSFLIVSGTGLTYITKENIFTQKIPKNCIRGTLISLRMTLNEKIDIYKYLNQIKYEY